MADKDTNPYYLRNVDLDKLDLSSYGKDYSPEELAAVKASLKEVQSQHHAAYEALPLPEKAQMYAQEKFGEYKKYAEQNPEIAFGAPAAAVGGAAIVGAQKMFGSLRDKISSLTNSSAAPLPDDAILAKQMATEKPTVAATPSTPAPVSQETPPLAVKGMDQTPEQIRKQKLAQAQAQLEGRTVAPTAPAPTPSAQTMTPEQLIASSEPKLPAGVTAEQDFGKTPKDIGLVEQSEYNALSKRVTAAEKKAAPKNSAPAPSIEAGPVSPEGRIPSYPSAKHNKRVGDVYGQGGWHWYQGQMGPKAEEEWLRQFGRTNQHYRDVTQAIKEGRLAGAPVVEGKGGSYPRESTVPEYIKGNASLSGMASLAGNALGGIELKKAYEHGKKTGDWSELGIGAVNQLVGNLAPRAAVPLALMSPNNVSAGTLDTPEARELFARAKKTGIAPPSR